MELAPVGAGYRLNTLFARFINVPELMQMFCQVADIQTANTLKTNRHSPAKTATAKMRVAVAH